ncbi:hypothetical protein ACEWY4_001395 [Coilia grayii]|uniref:Retrotransposon gag domain-containing protein n=1 Tax=Coilia grayii TaxID=363190 RepID=A0ABD1KSW0_9TELE
MHEPNQSSTADVGELCDFIQRLSPGHFPTERAKVAYIITRLTGKALDWATALWSHRNPDCLTSERFMDALKRVFDDGLTQRQASSRLLSLTQGQRSVVDYAIEFRTLAAETGWEGEALPSFNWASSTVTQWGLACKDHLSPDPPATNSVIVADTAIVPTDLTRVPAAYHDLSAVFSKDQAASLPPHRSYDLAIDLLPGTAPPQGRLYSLSIPETKAMDAYIQEALENGLIRPSTSPAAAGFFFVGKKDGGLRPCIDYRGLNKITLKKGYPGGGALVSTEWTRRVSQELFSNI